MDKGGGRKGGCRPAVPPFTVTGHLPKKVQSDRLVVEGEGESFLEFAGRHYMELDLDSISTLLVNIKPELLAVGFC